MKARTRTTHIIIHCAATRPSMDIGRAEIDRWHRERGFFGIGYHFVIRRSGEVQEGRPVGEIGAHAKPWNDRSVGICLVGGVAEDGKTPEANYTQEQWAALEGLIMGLRSRYPGAEVVGHRDVPGVAKACPSFDVRAWAREKGFAE